ncbi:MAG: 4-phosphoerythronate dehydrogenase, partial [SAR324 cluster bacterium]|nr:4-phosphoerythronate dehydrogenase [SAR324 cluster bacterium]
MKFIADKAIPYVQEAFSSIGQVDLLPSAEITPEVLQDVTGLLIRTTTKVTSTLLASSSVKFVGTATIGTDHIDLPYLANKGIYLSSAPGCNAVAVAEYILTALLALQQKTGASIKDRILGIIGAGNTGRALKNKAEAIGIRCILNDSPLFASSSTNEYIELDELIRRANIISIHVPLTRTGKYPTFHLVGDRALSRINPGTIIINTSRGETLDGQALKTNWGRLGGVILDVWENEPHIDADLLERVHIATPHIAGYSLEGKIRATDTIYRDACNFFGVKKTWKAADALLPYGFPELILPNGAKLLELAITQAYNIWEDDA